MVKDVFRFKSGAVAVGVRLSRHERVLVGGVLRSGESAWKVTGAGSRCNCPNAPELSLMLAHVDGPDSLPALGQVMEVA